jgi:hypothetical protein
MRASLSAAPAKHGQGDEIFARRCTIAAFGQTQPAGE